MRHASFSRSGLTVAAVAMLVSGALVAGRLSADPQPHSSQLDHRAKTSANELSHAFRSAAGQVLPAVVTIENRSIAEAGGMQDGNRLNELFRQHPELRRYFQAPVVPNATPHGIGSGVIIDPAGVILTNNHVVAGGGEVVVRLSDGREFVATEVKTDPKTDLAVVRIAGADKLVAAPLGDSDRVEIGDWVLALGQPFGLESTVTAGIISAKQRGLGIAARESFLQTDAAINPGNSGGPLVNLDGEVVGVNTAISSRSGGNQGIGFAVPVNLAKWVSDQLVQGGVVRRAYLGVGIQSITQALADQFQVKPREGVLVTEVRPDTPAARAGLRTGDVIVSFDAKPVATPQELQVIVEGARIGQKHALEVVRDGKHLTLHVLAEEQPESFGAVPPKTREKAEPALRHEESLGLQLQSLTPELAQQLGVASPQGVVVAAVAPNSPAERAGLAAGMVITQLNRQPVANLEQLSQRLDAGALKQGVLLLVTTPVGSQFLVLRA